MYELIILSLLMRSPMHGYLLAKVINHRMGPWARVSNGTLYPLLARLERLGYLTVATDEPGTSADAIEGERPQTERPCRTYAITPQGCQRFHALMLDTTANLSEYRHLFRQKVTSLYLLTAAERAYLIDHYCSYCETTALYFERHARDLAQRLDLPGDSDEYVMPRLALEAAIDVMARQAEEWRAELAWALRLRDSRWPEDAVPLCAPTATEHSHPRTGRAITRNAPEYQDRQRRQSRQHMDVDVDVAGRGGERHAHA